MKKIKNTKTPKTFILDTNVILHDASSIQQFQENDVVIPLSVIEELDHFKRGSQVINLNAREFATKAGLSNRKCDIQWWSISR